MRGNSTPFILANNTLFVDGYPAPLTEGQLYDHVYRMLISDDLVDVVVGGDVYTPGANGRLVTKARAE